MEVKVKTDMSYYEFLSIIQQVSKNSHSIQKKIIRKVYANYDINQVKNSLDKQIEYLTGLLSTKK